MDVSATYDRLLAAYGPQRWWPISHDDGASGYDRRFEVIVGAILTQMVAWRNVEKSLSLLAGSRRLCLDAMRDVPISELESLIRPSGFYRQKALKLKAFVSFLDGRFAGSLDALQNLATKDVRRELLTVRGIGEETADSIVLYAFDKPSFVVDTYTKRLCACFDIEHESYSDYQTMFETSLPRSARLWNEYHALIVRWGKDFGTGQKKTSRKARRIVLADGQSS